MNNRIANDQISQWGFTIAEVEKLGIAAAHKFSIVFGQDITDYIFKDLINLYKNIINNPEIYKDFAIWLKKRFDIFIEINAPLRIFTLNKVTTRGDLLLEKSLLKISKAIDEFINEGTITPKRISVIIYYLNLMYK